MFGWQNKFGHHNPMSNAVPVQYFQSIIAAQLAVAGALLFQVRFFDTSNAKNGAQVDPRLRLVLVVVIAETLSFRWRRCEKAGVPQPPRW